MAIDEAIRPLCMRAYCRVCNQLMSARTQEIVSSQSVKATRRRAIQAVHSWQRL